MILISIYKLEQCDFDWLNIINRCSIEGVERVVLLNQILINDLLNSSLFIECITKKLNEDFIIENNNLAWDWKLVTTSKLSKEKLHDENILSANAKHLYWPYIIEEVLSIKELTIEEKLPEVSAYLSITSETIQQKSWTAITEKLPNKELWRAIDVTKGKELFNWDWDLISSTEKIIYNFSFENLGKIEQFINWDKLSQNPQLSHIWKYSKNSFRRYAEWRDYVFGYLIIFREKWNFKLLSKIGVITWSIDIIDYFINDWDWDILSKESNLLTKISDDEVHFDIRNLKRYERRINWTILSEHYEVSISKKEFGQFLEKDWDFQLLSKHPNLSLSFEILQQTLKKNWDWKALTRHKDLKLTKELLLGQRIEGEIIRDVEEWAWIREQEWDWSHLSKEEWLDGELLKVFQDKSWDWKAVSENPAIVFDLSLLKLLVAKDEINWSAILQNSKTHINSETLRLLESTIDLSNEDWQSISCHPNLDFTKNSDNNSTYFDWNFVDRYTNFWDWNLLLLNQKIDITDLKILRRYQDQLDWSQISEHPSLEPKIEILEEFAEKLDWNIISRRITLNDEVLEKFEAYLNWEEISSNEQIKFTEDLIHRYSNQWEWHRLINNICKGKSKSF
ncbi:MAG: hypothetical protein IPN33_14400 [Saprospiraceae bacterium]|nr:hypothetical protein [Saprospiraceae bacterium]